MTFIDEWDSSPAAQYMQWTLHFSAPIYQPGWPTTWTANTDYTADLTPLWTIGSEYYHWIAYSFYRPITIGFDEYDWFDSTARLWPYNTESGYYTTFVMSVADWVNTYFRNVVSDKFFKEWVLVWKNIYITIPTYVWTYVVSSRIRFIASLIDSTWAKTAIWTSSRTANWIPVTWRSVVVSLLGDWLEVVWTDKRLFIEIEYEITHDGSVSSFSNRLYGAGITDSSVHYRWVFISCTVE